MGEPRDLRHAMTGDPRSAGHLVFMGGDSRGRTFPLHPGRHGLTLDRVTHLSCPRPACSVDHLRLEELID